MRQDQIDRIEAAFQKGYDVLAGDYVQYVAPDDTTYDLLTIMEDVERNEGLQIDEVGLRSGGIRELLFLRDYLDAQSVVFEPDGHFVILGERWDFVEKLPIQDHINSVGGIHNLVLVWVRRAVELNQSQSGSSWGYDI